MSMFTDYTFEQRLAFCQALANMVASDKKVEPEERAQLEVLVGTAGLSPDDPAVQQVIEAELGSPGSLTDILKRLNNRKLNAGLFRILVEMACVDGEVAEEERGKIAEAAGVFGFDAGAAQELTDWTLQSIQLEKRGPEILGRLS